MVRVTVLATAEPVLVIQDQGWLIVELPIPPVLQCYLFAEAGYKSN